MKPLLAVLGLALCVAARPVLAQPLNFMAEADPEVIRLLPPPAAAGSAETKSELEWVKAVQKDATAQEIEQANQEFFLKISAFAPEIGPWFTEENLPQLAALLEKAGKDGRAIGDKGRNHFKRPRPMVENPRITLAGKRPEGFSYPSGHSLRGTLYALILCELCPDQREAILARGQRIGWNRVILGVHYPSDVFAGRVVGQYLARMMLANPQFKEELAKVKVEYDAVKKQHAPATAPAKENAALLNVPANHLQSVPPKTDLAKDKNDTVTFEAEPAESKDAGESKVGLVRARSAVLHVTVVSPAKPATQPAPLSGGKLPDMRQVRQGSAVLIAPGLLITCAHLIEEAGRDGKVSVMTSAPLSTYPATVVGRDAATDIALLRCDLPVSSPAPLRFAPRMPAPGTPVYAIGYPLGDKQLVTSGIVSATGHTDSDMLPLVDYVVTDATVGPGSSGGALVDREGNLVGMMDALTAEGGVNKALGLAIPSPLLLAAVDQFRRGKEMQQHRGFLGIRAGDSLEPLNGAGNETLLVRIVDVMPGSPAEQAGLCPGDVIVAVNHQSVERLEQVRTRCLACYAEGILPITVVREGQKKTLTVRMGDIESEEAQAEFCDYCPLCGCSTF